MRGGELALVRDVQPRAGEDARLLGPVDVVAGEHPRADRAPLEVDECREILHRRTPQSAPTGRCPHIDPSVCSCTVQRSSSISIAPQPSSTSNPDGDFM